MNAEAFQALAMIYVWLRKSSHAHSYIARCVPEHKWCNYVHFKEAVKEDKLSQLPHSEDQISKDGKVAIICLFDIAIM